jgi:SAM-dependent methyltransferase
VSVFASTAEFYRRYRSGITPEVAELLIDAAPPGSPRSPRRLLDVGTGTGFVIDALLPAFDEAIGVDVDEDLLAVAREQFAGTDQVRLVHGAAESFTVPADWKAHLVTVCRAFHWFDRQAFLAHVVEFMAPGAAIAVLGDRSIWAGGDEWKDRARQVVQDMLGPARRAGAGTYDAGDGRFTDDLAGAGFADVTSSFVPVRRVRTVHSVIGLLHSMSFASPAVLGDRLDEFDTRIRETLTPLTDGRGELVDHNEFYIYTGTRP